MLPLYLLNAVKGAPVVVEQKSRVTVTGVLENVDNWMNVTVKDAVVANPFTNESRKVDNIYVRGVQIKLVKLPNDVVDHYKEQQLREKEHTRNRRMQGQGQGQGQGNHGNHGNQRRYNNGGNRRNNNRQQHERAERA